MSRFNPYFLLPIHSVQNIIFNLILVERVLPSEWSKTWVYNFANAIVNLQYMYFTNVTGLRNKDKSLKLH
jgi:hypothetical protein